MIITAEEMEANFAKYLRLAESEDLYLTVNGEIIGVFTTRYKNKLNIVNKLAGSVPDDITIEDVCEERLSKI